MVLILVGTIWMGDFVISFLGLAAPTLTYPIAAVMVGFIDLGDNGSG